MNNLCDQDILRVCPLCGEYIVHPPELVPHSCGTTVCSGCGEYYRPFFGIGKEFWKEYDKNKWKQFVIKAAEKKILEGKELSETEELFIKLFKEQLSGIYRTNEEYKELVHAKNEKEYNNNKFNKEMSE